jgi:hypothetical protein
MVGGGEKPLGGFLLQNQGNGARQYLQAEQSIHPRRRNGVGQVGNHGKIGGGVGQWPNRAINGIGALEMEISAPSEFPVQEKAQPPVNLHGEQFRPAVEDFLRNGTEARPDFDDGIPGPNARNGKQPIDHVPIDEEILTQSLRWIDSKEFQRRNGF